MYMHAFVEPEVKSLPLAILFFSIILAMEYLSINEYYIMHIMIFHNVEHVFNHCILNQVAAKRFVN